MPTANLKLKIENCRAVHSAEIELSEITVLAGVNASGKSTIARIFHELIGYSAEYERLLSVNLIEKFIDEYRGALRILLPQTRQRGDISFRGISNDIKNGDLELNEAVEKIKLITENFPNSIEALPPEEKNRTLAVLFRAVGIDENENIQNVITKITAALEEMLQSYEKYTQHRDYGFCRNRTPSGHILTDGTIQLHEGDDWICSFHEKDDENNQKNKKNGEIFGIKRAIYIESPFKSIPKEAEDSLEVEDGFTHARQRPLLQSNKGGDDLFKVLQGRIASEKTDPILPWMPYRQKWIYQREDGASFDLQECATGIRSLSILNILYENGWLDNETLLIIDEPEAHLHPQWVVEYARILVLLSKEFQVRLLLTSHSPEMINALEEIAQKEGMAEKIRFYLAEKAEGEAYKFDYHSLGNRTSDIFKTFNVAFKLITDYAE